MEHFFFVVEPDQAGGRLDQFLCHEMEDVTRSRIQKWNTEGHILVNKKTVKTGYKLREADYIEVQAQDPEELTDAVPEEMQLDILYEDEDLAIVNKPQGMVVHPAAGHATGTLVNGLMYHFQGKLSGINGVLRPGIVHRIDKDTSGLLVICKSDRAHQKLGAMLAEHDITRRYHAIVLGNLTQDEGTINAPIGRSDRDRKMMAITPKGRRAVTHYRVLERFGAFTYIELTLETGRTHQIRVHMKSTQHPVLADPLYGVGTVAGEARRLLSGVDPEALAHGQLLHAKVLGFVHPVTGEYMEWESELPERFTHVLSKLRENYR